MANSLPNTNVIGLPDKASARARSGSATDLRYLSPGDVLKKSSAQIAARVATTRSLQRARYASLDGVRTNAGAGGTLSEQVAAPDNAGHKLLTKQWKACASPHRDSTGSSRWCASTPISMAATAENA